MALIVRDRIKNLSSSTGTGNFSAPDNTPGFGRLQNFIAAGDTFYYVIQHQTVPNEYEVGLGTCLTSSPSFPSEFTFSRSTVLAGTSGTAPVDFSAGTKEVFVTAAAHQIGPNNVANITAPTASASLALTTLVSRPIIAGEIQPGSEYEFFASLRVINTTAASNAVVTLSVGATNVLVLTQAIGTTAAAAPGAAVIVEGVITFLSTTQAECVIRAVKQAAVAFNAVANTSAPITVSAAGATTIDLKFNTSAATSTFIARQASIRRVK